MGPAYWGLLLVRRGLPLPKHVDDGLCLRLFQCGQRINLLRGHLEQRIEHGCGEEDGCGYECGKVGVLLGS